MTGDRRLLVLKEREEPDAVYKMKRFLWIAWQPQVYNYLLLRPSISPFISLKDSSAKKIRLQLDPLVTHLCLTMTLIDIDTVQFYQPAKAVSRRKDGRPTVSSVHIPVTYGKGHTSPALGLNKG